MSRNSKYINEAFSIFDEVNDIVSKWKEGELKRNITELNIKHLLDNLDKALVQVNEDEEETINKETNND